MTAILLIAALVVPTPPAQDAAASLVLDKEQSFILVETGTAGLFGFLGHDHAILAREWQAKATYDPQNPSNSSVKVIVAAKSLVIDSKEALAKADQDSAPDPDDIAEIQKKMLSERVLAADQYPQMTFESQKMERTEEGLSIVGLLTIRGRTQEVRVPVKTASRGEQWQFSGEFEIRQTEFGIEPESIAGVVKVADKLEISFQFVTAATPRTQP